MDERIKLIEDEMAHMLGTNEELRRYPEKFTSAEVCMCVCVVCTRISSCLLHNSHIYEGHGGSSSSSEKHYVSVLLYRDSASYKISKLC